MSTNVYRFAISDTDAFDVTHHFLYPVRIPGQDDTPRPIEIVSRGDSPSFGSGPYLRIRGVVKTYVTYNGQRQLVYTSWKGTNGNTRKELWFEKSSPDLIWFYAYRYYRGTLSSGSYRVLLSMQFNPGSNKPFKAKRDQWTLRSNGKWVKSTGSWGNWEAGFPVEYERIQPTGYDREQEMFLRAVYGGGYEPQIEQAFGRAYLAAANSLPDADVNLIGNIKEAIDYIKGAIGAIKDPASFLGSVAKTFTNPKDVWLQYRYVYKTNQMDAKELKDLVSRMDYLTTCCDGHLKCIGHDTAGRYDVGCVMSFPVSSVLPQDILDVVKQFGLNVTPSNMWDLVPFSFMVDWFLGIGDKLSFFEDWAGAAELQPNSIWIVIRTTLDDGSTVYLRTGHRKPVVPPLYTSRETSSAVVQMRIADTIAIFT